MLLRASAAGLASTVTSFANASVDAKSAQTSVAQLDQPPGAGSALGTAGTGTGTGNGTGCGVGLWNGHGTGSGTGTGAGPGSEATVGSDDGHADGSVDG